MLGKKINHLVIQIYCMLSLAMNDGTNLLLIVLNYGIHNSAFIMKYKGNTISKPVVGKEARELLRAINSGSRVASEQGIATAKRIAERILKQQK